VALAIVCGATGGLGVAVVAAFVARGDRVVAVARSEDGLRRLAGYGGAVRGETADLTEPSSVEALWARIDAAYEPPKWVVNLTGGFAPGSVIDTSPELYARMLAINLASAFWSSRAAAIRLRAAGQGVIVNVAARSAVGGGAGTAAYAVSKAGVVKLTEVLAQELKAGGVRVNAVLPALIDTPANRAAIPATQMRQAVAPEAIAEVILFLCSDASAPITGAAVPVGGRL